MDIKTDIPVFLEYEPGHLKMPVQIDEMRNYGSSVQSKIDAFSKTLAKIVFETRNDSAESLLDQAITVLEEVDQRQKSRVSRHFWMREEISTINYKLYRKLLKTIDELKLALQLEQVGLIKEMHVIERAENQIVLCCAELDEYLLEGKQHLSDLTKNEPIHPDQADFTATFQRKLDELLLSKTIAEQGYAQAVLMKENAVDLESKIRNAVLNTIPLWRNRIILLFGIDAMQERTSGVSRLGGFLKKTSSGDIEALDRDLKLILSDISKAYNALQECAHV